MDERSGNDIKGPKTINRVNFKKNQPIEEPSSFNNSFSFSRKNSSFLNSNLAEYGQSLASFQNKNPNDKSSINLSKQKSQRSQKSLTTKNVSKQVSKKPSLFNKNNHKSETRSPRKKRRMSIESSGLEASSSQIDQQPQKKYKLRVKSPNSKKILSVTSLNQKQDSTRNSKQSPNSKKSRTKQLLRSYLAFDNLSTDTSKIKLPDDIKPNFNIGKYKIVYHEKGYLWGRSRIHFSNYRIQVNFWCFVIGLLLFEGVNYCYKRYEGVLPHLYLGFYCLFILYNLLLLPDFVYQVKFGNCSALVGVTIGFNLVYWGIELYGYLRGIEGIWIFGFFFMLIDLVLFCYFYSNKRIKIHQTYNGVLETMMSVVRFMIFAKLKKAFDIFWVSALFPLTGFSIFSTFLFLFLTVQELTNCMRKKKNRFNQHGSKLSSTNHFN